MLRHDSRSSPTSVNGNHMSDAHDLSVKSPALILSKNSGVSLAKNRLRSAPEIG